MSILVLTAIAAAAPTSLPTVALQESAAAQASSDVSIWANNGIGALPPATALSGQAGPESGESAPPDEEPQASAEESVEETDMVGADETVAADEISGDESTAMGPVEPTEGEPTAPSEQPSAPSPPVPAPAPPAPAPAPAPAAPAPAPPAPAPAHPAPSSFACTLFIGYSQTDNWFSSAESVLGSDRYELLWINGGSARRWADPRFEGWRNAIQSPCARGSTTPDRVVMDVTNHFYLTGANTNGNPVGDMEGVIRNVISTIRNRYPSARQIVLQPVVGGPAHATCPWRGAQEGVVRASYNHPIIHEAIGRVMGGDVVMEADSAVRTCADYSDDIGHLTPGARGPIGQAIAQSYRGS